MFFVIYFLIIKVHFWIRLHWDTTSHCNGGECLKVKGRESRQQKELQGHMVYSMLVGYSGIACSLCLVLVHPITLFSCVQLSHPSLVHIPTQVMILWFLGTFPSEYILSVCFTARPQCLPTARWKSLFGCAGCWIFCHAFTALTPL